MNLFNETYNCYFQIMKEILSRQDGFSLDDLQSQINHNGFEESLLYMIPKLSNGEWNLLEKDDDLYYSKLSESFYVPLSNLQKSYLKTILQDERMQLFLDSSQIESLQAHLTDVPTLWNQNTFHYYDKFSDGDFFEDASYQTHFRTLLHAIKHKQYVDIDYSSRENHRVHHHYIPCRLEYSIKNEKFRLLSAKKTSRNHHKTEASGNFTLEILNLERITDVTLLDKFCQHDIDLNSLIRSTYYKEPVRLLIRNERNALERTMLHFANYEKNTTKINDNLYECLIYYNEAMETELLIEVLSFGPMIQVLGNERFLKQLKRRLNKQSRFTYEKSTS